MMLGVLTTALGEGRFKDLLQRGSSLSEEQAAAEAISA